MSTHVPSEEQREREGERPGRSALSSLGSFRASFERKRERERERAIAIDPSSHLLLKRTWLNKWLEREINIIYTN